MKMWSKITHRMDPPVTPDIDHDALERAKAHVAEQRVQTARRWDDVRAVASALRERSDRNGFAEAILADRKRRGHA